jgi:hypothetical protein
MPLFWTVDHALSTGVLITIIDAQVTEIRTCVGRHRGDN